MSQRITIQVDEVPEVEVIDAATGELRVHGWWFSGNDFVPTAEDVAAFAVAKAWFEQHPETVESVDE